MLLKNIAYPLNPSSDVTHATKFYIGRNSNPKLARDDIHRESLEVKLLNKVLVQPAFLPYFEGAPCTSFNHHSVALWSSLEGLTSVEHWGVT
jgi:hypothetical protein